MAGQAAGENLSSWLNNIDPCPQSPDIYVIGFQEVVELNTTSAWHADETNTRMVQILSGFFLNFDRCQIVLFDCLNRKMARANFEDNQPEAKIRVAKILPTCGTCIKCICKS